MKHICITGVCQRTIALAIPDVPAHGFCFFVKPHALKIVAIVPKISYRLSFYTTHPDLTIRCNLGRGKSGIAGYDLPVFFKDLFNHVIVLHAKSSCNSPHFAEMFLSEPVY